MNKKNNIQMKMVFMSKIMFNTKLSNLNNTLIQNIILQMENFLTKNSKLFYFCLFIF